MKARARAAPYGLAAFRLAAFWLALAATGCRRADEGDESRGASASTEVATPAPSSSLAVPARDPAPRQGMVWIPRGALVAGTPPDRLPRMPDQEMPGEQVVLQGFYMDVFPYPNEEGAIPTTNVTQEQAATLCAGRGKRLCSELEWERACKGPDNHVYEYGDQHRADRCGTGGPPALRPSGLKVGCRSEFGVRDMHGGALEWTVSPWGRGTKGSLFAVRGGNGSQGEVAGRCANAWPRAADRPSGTLGFRCCAGTPNTAEVSLVVRRGRKLEALERIDAGLGARLAAVIPEEARARLAERGKPKLERLWIWRPTGNEELYATSVCASKQKKNAACGVLVARDYLGTSTFVAWADSGHSVASLHADRDPRDLWLLGGDKFGSFKRLIGYSFGRVTVHGEDRRVGKRSKK